MPIPRLATLDDARAWYGDWLQAAALPLWSTAGFDAPRGSFQEVLGVDGVPGGSFRRARVQSRQIWVFATAARAGWGDGYGEIARRACAFYLAHYRRPDGLFGRVADPDGTLTDPTPTLYEQAFSMLALAGLQALDGGKAQDAARVREALDAHRHPAGGWREAGEHPFQANAHMHLFEAALAWEELGEPAWAAMADEIAALAVTRFIEPERGILREFFDAAWEALPEDAGGLIEPGHQFEWAWLLDRWGRRRGDASAVAAARRLYGHGQRGVDARREVAVGSLWSNLTVRDPTARLWAQTEHLRAALTFGGEPEVLAAARGLSRFLDTPARGAWRDKEHDDGTFVQEPSPATSLYHLVAGLMPLLSSPGSGSERERVG